MTKPRWRAGTRDGAILTGEYGEIIPPVGIGRYRRVLNSRGREPLATESTAHESA